jgi:hypothetical protein
MAKKAETRKQTSEPLVRPTVVRALAAVALAVMALALIVDAIFGHVSHFGVDGIAGAYAVIGIVSGFVIIGIAKGLGRPLSRPDTYYGDDTGEAGK